MLVFPNCPGKTNMQTEAVSLEALAKSNRWTDLEREWLASIEQSDSSFDELMTVIDIVVKAGQGELADTLGWAWLTQLKTDHSPQEVLERGRQLIVHLSDGNELREEILNLYRQTHQDRADIEEWIDRSGLKSGKSVRRALRFLDVGLELSEGCYVIHRTDEVAGQITRFDFDADEVQVKTPRRTHTLDVATVIEEYDLADPNDFRVLEQVRPDEIAHLATSDPCALAIGILRGHGNKMNRDSFKLTLSPRYVPAPGWSDWWTKLRNAIKKSRNLRIEGRSPMFLVFDEVGQSPEQELMVNFEKAETPREWLEQIEGYLRLCRESKHEPDVKFLDRVQEQLVSSIERFWRHKEPALAFATALVIERLAMDGVPVSSDAHGTAIEKLRQSADPVRIVASISDARLWPLALTIVEQALPDKWPEVFAECILYSPAGQCDVLAKKVESAGKGELLPEIASRALSDPGRYTDALMWLWKGPSVQTPLGLPPLSELLTLVLGLVGPARMSEGKVAGQTVNEMRAKVRSGLSAKDYETFRRSINDLDDAMAQSTRRLVDRAEGLGPSVQDDMSNIVRARFPHLYLRPKVTMWDDDSVLYFTPGGLKSKQDEVAELVNVKMRENAKAIGEAAAHGDLSENSEYKFALEERDLLRARVAKLNREISLAKLLERSDIPSDHVSIGHRLVIEPVSGGAPFNITILGYDESDISEKVYSYHSPLARELLGKRVGDTASINLDDGIVEYRIVKIESFL